MTEPSLQINWQKIFKCRKFFKYFINFFEFKYLITFSKTLQEEEENMNKKEKYIFLYAWSCIGVSRLII